MAKLSGGLNNWYVVPVKHPQRKEQEPYQAECEDIIQALGMTFDEGCAFKALWRNAAARMGNGKPGNSAVYDAEKMVHYTNRILAKERLAVAVEPMFRYEHVESCSDSCPTSSTEDGDNGWVYSNVKPFFTRKWSRIEYEYKDRCKTYTCFPGGFLFESINWENIYRYRITY